MSDKSYNVGYYRLSVSPEIFHSDGQHMPPHAIQTIRMIRRYAVTLLILHVEDGYPALVALSGYNLNENFEDVSVNLRHSRDHHVTFIYILKKILAFRNKQ